jgi:hypothetical protein
MYTSYGLPPFFVIVLFIPIPDGYVYVGGRSDERANADPNEPAMIRIVFDHIARTIESPEMGIKFFEGVRYYILHRGLRALLSPGLIYRLGRASTDSW